MTLLSAPYTYHLFLSLLSLDIYPTLFHMRTHTHTHVLHTQFKALETNFSEYHALSSSRTVEFGDNILFFYQYWYWQNPLADGNFQPEEMYSYFSGKRMALSDFVFLKIFQLSPEPITKRKGDLGRPGVGVRFYLTHDFTSCCLDGHHLLLYS